MLTPPFSYRLFWCYQLAITVLFIPLSVWMLWGDRDKLGNATEWITDLGAALFLAVIVAMIVALPLTFVLRPAAPRAAS